MMKKTYNHILVWGVIFYSICIVCFCFTPQEQSTVGVGTPGIQHLGRLVFLVSLGIECTQLILDFFFDFNRVFEIDDLWTNTLGGYLAWLLYKRLHKNKVRN